MRIKRILAVIIIAIVALSGAKTAGDAEIVEEKAAETVEIVKTEHKPKKINRVKIDLPAAVVEIPEPPKRKAETPEDKRALKFMQSDLGEWIVNYSYGEGIDPFLIFAMAERESNFKPDCVGDKGASIGLMQVQPKWNRERMEKLEVKDLKDPKDCVRVAIDILLEYAGRNSDLFYVLMAYNGGESYAKKYYETSPSDYAKEITERAAILCEIYEGATD